jgi:antitoxin component HigA of HigAB toxin-antitoxin module
MMYFAEGRALKQTAAKPRVGEKRQANGRPAPPYLALIAAFPLRPLRSERDYDAAVAVLDALAVRPEGSLDSGEQDYLDTLTMLVEAYDREHHDIDPEPRDPLTILKYVMQESGIRKPADYFKVSPALFLQTD